jgi:gamma-glutamylcyclotransferase (GGCT)/AIG2-like uncharacterized protein YtfP
MDRWWMVSNVSPTVDEVLFYLNRSNRATDTLGGCDLRFKALNQLFSAYDESTDEPRGNDVGRTQHRSLQRLLTSALPTETRLCILDNPNVAALAKFRPLILDHSKLHRYRLSDDIPVELREGASEQHLAFSTRFANFDDQRNGKNRDKTLNALADTLWMVRSNLAHGEKTVAGPDPQRNERNAEVAEVVFSVLDVILDEILEKPSCSLISYGTLAPGQVNARVLEHLDGTWTDAEISGVLWDDEHGLPRFRWTPRSETLSAVQVFRSKALPSTWHDLDRFEGSSYSRNLVRFTTEGVSGVGNCYENSSTNRVTDRPAMGS